MNRWNGWGDENIVLELSPDAARFLSERIGPGIPQTDYPRRGFLNRIPSSRLPNHPLISKDPAMRLDHGHGQSLPDWVRLRGGLLPRLPDGVATPATAAEAQEALAFAQSHGALVIPFGGGTSVVGHLSAPSTERPVLTISLRKLDRMLAISTEDRLATFQAGILGPGIEAALRSHGMTLGHFPQSFEYSSLGGWVATRSAGQQSHHYGRIEDIFAGGRLLSPRGALMLPPFPASAAGPDLRHLVLGSEGRLGLLTEATVRISPLPERDDVVAIFFPGWEESRRAVQALAGSGIPVSMIRLSTAGETAVSLALAGGPRKRKLLNGYLGLRRFSPARACLCLVGFTGTRARVRSARGEAQAVLRSFRGIVLGKTIGRAWQANRFRSAYLRNTLWDRGYAVDTLETAVSWRKVDQTVQDIEAALIEAAARFGEQALVFTHLSHVYPSGSSIYTTVVFRPAHSPEATLERWQGLKQAASEAVIRNGATISHQHGVGTDHRRYLTAEKGEIGIEALRRAIACFDPDQMFNPDKLLPAPTPEVSP